MNVPMEDGLTTVSPLVAPMLNPPASIYLVKRLLPEPPLRVKLILRSKVFSVTFIANSSPIHRRQLLFRRSLGLRTLERH